MDENIKMSINKIETKEETGVVAPNPREHDGMTSVETPDTIVVDGVEYKRKKCANIKEYRKQYYRNYYKKNKDKYNVNRRRGCVGKRGLGKKMKYKVSVLGDVGKPLMTQNYKTLGAIGISLQLPIHVIRRIYNGAYLKSKKMSVKKYTKYQIDKL